MGKTIRYFDQPSDTTNNSPEDNANNSDKNKNNSDVIVYNVNPKFRPWGRRREDNYLRNKSKIVKRLPNPNPKYKGKAPIAPELLEKYKRGKSTVDQRGIRTKLHKKRFEYNEQKIKYATEIAARAEILLTEEPGYLEAGDGETTTQFTQQQILESVDITAATKHFDLHLNDFGPYRSKYTRNGRHLLLGGKKGHVAAFDWVTKRLHCEMNVMESVHDISWLHIETMFAVAQKDYVHIYDNQGIELHCLKVLNKVCRMEFLPYHFLLATSSDEGYLSWLDISIGQLVNQFPTNLGRLTQLTQNPWNALLCLGHSKGVVSMWSPNSREPLAKMLCHQAPLTALHVDPKGMYMATAATNRSLKIWDIRKLDGPLQEYKLRSAANNLNFSQKSMLAIGMGNIVEVYRDCCTTAAKRAYLRHRFPTSIGNLSFCPYEDVLGVSTNKGFTSLLVPGSGEPNYDGYEINPYQTKKQRREAEVKALLEKIQPDLISLNPTEILAVDVPTLEDKIEAKQKLLFVKPPQIKYEPRKKAKGKGGSANMAKNKKIVQEQAKREFVKNMKQIRKELQPELETKKKNNKWKKPANVLDRFLPKKKNSN